MCVLSTQSWSQCGESGPLGEDGTTPRGEKHPLALQLNLQLSVCLSVCNVFHFVIFHTGSDRPGGVCRGSPSTRGQCVCQRHPGPLPSPPGIRLWPRGSPGCPAAGQHHHLTHSNTPHRQPGLHTTALGLLQRYWDTPDEHVGSE